MDNNNIPVSQDPVASPAPPPAQPVPVPLAPPVKEGGNKMALWLIGGLVIIIVVVGLVYWYLGSQPAKQASRPIKTPPPVAQKEISLEEDLDTIQIQDLEAEFSEVDKGLESL